MVSCIPIDAPKARFALQKPPANFSYICPVCFPKIIQQIFLNFFPAGLFHALFFLRTFSPFSIRDKSILFVNAGTTTPAPATALNDKRNPLLYKYAPESPRINIAETASAVGRS